MAGAETSELFDCSIEQFYKIITDYKSYPLFLDEVKDTNMIDDQGDKKLVQFKVNVIKNFQYSLWMDESKKNELHWAFHEGDLFKKSTGSWILEEEAGKTRAHYKIESKFKMLVPGPITKTLISVNLPNMMSSYKKRIKEVYGNG